LSFSDGDECRERVPGFRKKPIEPVSKTCMIMSCARTGYWVPS
jgi:hypothetical protein